jgi:hypothetical protein
LGVSFARLSCLRRECRRVRTYVLYRTYSSVEMCLS